MTVHRSILRTSDLTGSRKELLPICFIAIFGCLGFLYIFQSFCSVQQPTENANMKVNLATSAFEMPFFQSQNTDHSLIIQGNTLPNSEIDFTIASFDDNAKYNVNFGDGIETEITEPNFQHIFSTPGAYELSLQVQYNNRSALIFQQKLEIEESAAIVSNKSVKQL